MEHPALKILANQNEIMEQLSIVKGGVTEIKAEIVKKHEPSDDWRESIKNLPELPLLFYRAFPLPLFHFGAASFSILYCFAAPFSFLSNTSQSAKYDNHVRTYIYLCDAKFDRECPWGGELPSGNDLLRWEPT